MRLARGIERSRPYLKSVPRTRRPNPERLPDAVTPIRRQYAFIVEVEGQHAQTGEVFRRFVTISTDELLAVESLEQQAVDLVNKRSRSYQMQAVSAVVATGMKAGAAGRL